MRKILLMSDTHSHWDDSLKTYCASADEIWHAGDFGTITIADRLSEIAPLVGVYGNIDGQDIRRVYPQDQHFEREGVRIWMTHIGGVPGRYCLPVKKRIETDPPDLFVCGHSHILKVARDPALGRMLYMNPGAAGKQGFQVHRTLIRFSIEKGSVFGVEVIQLA